MRPDDWIQSCPNLSKSCPKSSHSSFYLKIAQRSLNILANEFVTKSLQKSPNLVTLLPINWNLLGSLPTLLHPKQRFRAGSLAHSQHVHELAQASRVQGQRGAEDKASVCHRIWRWIWTQLKPVRWKNWTRTWATRAEADVLILFAKHSYGI